MTKYIGKAKIRSLDMGDGVSIISLAPDSMTMPKGQEFKIEASSKMVRLSSSPKAGMTVHVEISDGKVVAVSDLR